MPEPTSLSVSDFNVTIFACYNSPHIPSLNNNTVPFNISMSYLNHNIGRTRLRSSTSMCMCACACRAISGRGWIQPHPHYVRILGDSPHQNTSSAVHLRTKEEEWLSLLLLCMQVSARLCYKARIWGISALVVMNLQALAGLLPSFCVSMFIHKISKPLPLHIIIFLILATCHSRCWLS